MKKTLSIISAILVISVIAALCITSVSAAFVPGADSFVPENITIKKSTGIIEIDANPTPDATYGTKGVALTGRVGDTDAGCTASLAWDEEYLYIHMVVNDGSNYTDLGGQFYSDSIEFYVDFDNNKTKYNKLQGNANNIYAGQFRVQRGGTTIDAGVMGSSEMEKLINNSHVSVKENGVSGYVVEIKFAHGKHAIDKTIGFALQVNDGNPGSQTRTGQLFSNPNGDVQDHCYKFTSFLDNGILDGYTPSTTRTKAANDVSADETVVITSTPTTSSKPSTTSKPSTSSTASATTSAPTGSTPTTSAPTASSDTSAVASAPAGTVSGTEATPGEDSTDNTPIDGEPNTPDNQSGFSFAAILAIFGGSILLFVLACGGVLLVIAAVVVVIIIVIKKKKNS